MKYVNRMAIMPIMPISAKQERYPLQGYWSKQYVIPPIIVEIIAGRIYASLTYERESKPIIMRNMINCTMRCAASAAANSINI